MKRRNFLKGTLAGGVLTVAAGSGLLRPSAVLAAEWPKGAFDAKGADEAVKSLYGMSGGADNAAVKLTAPLQAENGAVVPIKVDAGVAGVESIAIIVDKNPRPLATSVDLSGTAAGFYSTRIKMGSTSKVTAYVKAGGKLHTASQTVKVTVGGCGG